MLCPFLCLKSVSTGSTVVFLRGERPLANVSSDDNEQPAVRRREHRDEWTALAAFSPASVSC